MDTSLFRSYERSYTTVAIFFIFLSFSFVSVIPTQVSVGELLFWIYLIVSLKILYIFVEAFQIHKHSIFYTIFIFYLLLQLIHQVDFSFKDIVNPIYFMFFLFVLYLFFLQHFSFLNTIVKALLYSVYAHFIVSILQLIDPAHFYFGLKLSQLSPLGSFYRVTGLFTNPNDLMLYLTPLIPFTYHYKFRVTRYILLITLLLSFSKVALFFVAITLLYDFYKASIKIKFFFLFFALTMYIVFFSHINHLLGTLIDAIQYRFTHAHSLEDRLQALHRVVNYYREWLLFGAGPMGDLKFSDVRIHNLFISLIVQYGIFSVFFIIGFFSLILYSLRYNYNSHTKYFYISILIWSLGVFVNTLTYIKALYVIPILSFVVISRKRVD